MFDGQRPIANLLRTFLLRILARYLNLSRLILFATCCKHLHYHVRCLPAHLLWPSPAYFAVPSTLSLATALSRLILFAIGCTDLQPILALEMSTDGLDVPAIQRDAQHIVSKIDSPRASAAAQREVTVSALTASYDFRCVSSVLISAAAG
jgi:hypothetical protein